MNLQAMSFNDGGLFRGINLIENGFNPAITTVQTIWREVTGDLRLKRINTHLRNQQLGCSIATGNGLRRVNEPVSQEGFIAIANIHRANDVLDLRSAQRVHSWSIGAAR